MAQYAPVCGLPLMHTLLQRQLLGSTLLLLAHEVRKNIKGWAELIEHYRNNYNHSLNRAPTIILDNSLIELGSAIDPVELIDIATDIQATHYVLPDVLGNADATERATVQAQQRIINAFGTVVNLHPIAVVQGHTMAELRKLADVYVLDYGIRMIAIPRVIANRLGSRKPICSFIGAGLPGSPVRIHLLGCSEKILDDITCASMTGVASIDSGNFITLGAMGQKPSMFRWNHLQRLSNHFDLNARDDNIECIATAVEIAHDWFGH